MKKKSIDQKTNLKSSNEDTSYAWIQVRSRIGKILSDNFVDSILIAGSFGNPRGHDLDTFIVFKDNDTKAILRFFELYNNSIIKPFFNDGILLVPFRYFTSKVFIPFLAQKTEVELKTILPIHTLIFPDLRALLEWEDHEIIKHILDDLNNDDQVWIGQDQIPFIKSLLKPIDLTKRKKTYEELLFSAMQEAAFNVLTGLEEVALEKAAYAVRYLAEDDSLCKYGVAPDSKADILSYMISENHKGFQFLLENKINKNNVEETIAELFEYWRPSTKIKKHHTIKRLKEIKEFCSNLRSPILVFDEMRIKENSESMMRAFSIFGCRVEINYAIKANSIIPIVQYIADLSYGGLCATSYSDFATLRKIKVEPQKVCVHLNYPSEELLIEVINSNYSIIISDEITPLRIIDLKKKNLIDIKNLSIFIRIKSEIANRIGYHRFGIKEDKIVEIFNFFKESNIEVKGLAIHSNAASTDPHLWSKSLHVIRKIIENHWSYFFTHLPQVIIGGGFATATTLNSWGTSIEIFAEEAKNIIGNLNIKKLILEPGRYLIGDAGFVYTTIIGTKNTIDKNDGMLIVDAGSNFLIPLDSADYSFHDLQVSDVKQQNPSYIIADGWSSFGRLGRTTGLSPDKKIGDNILIGNAGAYTYSMASNSGDGLPSYRLIRQENMRSKSLFSHHFVQNEKYLNAKYELDKSLLKDVLRRIKDLLSGKDIRILDVGCGIGHYLLHLLDNGFQHKFRKIEYFGIDLSNEMILLAKKKWESNIVRNVNITFAQGDAHNLYSSFNKTNFDLVVGLSLLEYIKDDSPLHQMVHITKPGGILHFQINYDGITQFEPTFDRELEEKIINLFNLQLIPDPFCGRKLYSKVIQENLEVLDFRVDDWVIVPLLNSITGQEYTSNQEFFLETVIDAVENLKSNSTVSQLEKNEWVNLRQSQLKKRELLFICRQCSILARK